MEAWLGFIHPEIDWQGNFTRLEGTQFRGREGMRLYWSETNAALELVVSFDEMRDLGDPCWVWATCVGARREVSQSTPSTGLSSAFGTVMSSRQRLDSHADALEAAGLSE